MTWWLWAPEAVYWAAQHAELAQQKFATTFMLAAVASAATLTWYVYAVWGWHGLKNIACMVRDRPQHAVGVVYLALSLVYGEGRLCQQRLPCQPALLLSVLDFLQLLLVRRSLVRPSMMWVSHGRRQVSETSQQNGPGFFAVVQECNGHNQGCCTVSTQPVRARQPAV